MSIEQFTTLRKQIIEKTAKKVKERKKTNPEMTPEEQELGLYIEYIQPQVLDAVRTLRAKGYNTISSGFWEDNKQRIGFHETTFSEFDLPHALLEFLKENQVAIYIEPDEIILTCNQFLNIDKLKEVWDKIAEAMPDLKGEVKTRKETFKKEMAPEEK